MCLGVKLIYWTFFSFFRSTLKNFVQSFLESTLGTNQQFFFKSKVDTNQ